MRIDDSDLASSLPGQATRHDAVKVIGKSLLHIVEFDPHQTNNQFNVATQEVLRRSTRPRNLVASTSGVAQPHSGAMGAP
jgi:hypothetical protein